MDSPSKLCGLKVIQTVGTPDSELHARPAPQDGNKRDMAGFCVAEELIICVAEELITKASSEVPALRVAMSWTSWQYLRFQTLTPGKYCEAWMDNI